MIMISETKNIVVRNSTIKAKTFNFVGKYFFKQKLFLLLSFLFLTSINNYAQNRYLEFNNGKKEYKENVETTPKRTYNSSKSSSVEVGYSFTGAYVAEIEVKNTSYNFLHIDGFAKMSQVGAPALPAHNDVIAMPRGASGKIVILESEYFEYDGYMVHPVLEPAVDTEGAPSPTFRKDKSIYEKDAFFPKNVVEIVGVNLNRGTGLANVQLRPVQFNPVTGKIRVYTNVKYKLEITGGEGSFDYLLEDNSLHYINLLKRNVINSEMLPYKALKKKSEEVKSGTKNYIIITHDEFLDQANDLAIWKRQLGYTVEVVSKSSWKATQVKSEIYDRYVNWSPKPDYFVIIGDHTGAFAVPGEIHQDPMDGEDFASDLYFACMDGESDHVPDMAHGRISVSTSAEATTVVNKIINYEKTPTTSTDYYSNILNCAQWQDTDDDDGYADRRFCHTSEDIRDYLQNNYQYTSTRIYYRDTDIGSADVASLHYNNGYYSDGQLLPAELRDASFNWSGSSSDITSEIDMGKFFVFHRDHGYTGGSGWHRPYYTTSTMANLNNGDKLPIVFSMNCHTGEFQLDNCFSEKLLRMENKGAVGVVAAAYYSYSGYNDALSEGMIDAIWSDPGLYASFGTAGNGGSYTIGVGNNIFTMGDVVNQGLHAMMQNYNDNKYSFELFHYFGDPTMKIWVADPNDSVIVATHNATIDCNASSYSISGSTAGSKATLVFNNELIAETILDENGDGTITYVFDESGIDVLLTVSKLHHKPYVSSLVLTGACSYVPSVEINAVTNVSTSTATFNGEITADNSSAITECGFVYSTSPEPIIGGDNVIVVKADPLVTLGVFTIDVSELPVATMYYSKAYATNGVGTRYSDVEIFITECNVPATQVTNLAVTEVNDNDITLTWTSGGDHVIVLAKEASNIDEEPISSMTYAANSDFTLGEDVNSGNIAVYSGTDETITITNLNEITEYYFAVYKYNDNEKCYNIVTPAMGSATTVGYCAASGGGTEYINGVELGTISTSSTGDNGYENHTDLSTDLSLGSTNTLTIVKGASYYGSDIGVWIDFNNNYSFTDAGENVICSIDEVYGANGAYSLVIPENAVLGSHRMRIRIKYLDSSCGSTCGITYLGEVEDYTVNIQCDNAKITTSPESTTACVGSDVTFNIVAEGSGLSYQWKKGGVDITDANTSSYSIASVNINDAADYTCIVTNACGSVTSDAAVLTVNANTTSISHHPVDESACLGETASFSVTAINATTYKWQKNGDDILGADASIFSISTISQDDEGIYACKVSGACPAITSENATLAIPKIVEITNSPSSQITCVGEELIFIVTASGDGLSYQWKNGTTDVGINSNTYTIEAVEESDAGNITCIVSGACGSDVTSDIAELIVNANTVAITGHPTNAEVCEGEQIDFFVTANNATAYQWQKNGVDITDANASSYSIASVDLDDADDYTCIVSNGCGSVTSDVAVLIVNAYTTSISLHPVDESACLGGTASFSVTATNAIAYNWQKDGEDILGADTSVFSIATVSQDDEGIYACKVSGPCQLITSEIATLSIPTIVEITNSPSSQTTCVGEELIFIVTASGDGLSYQWKNGTTNVGINSNTYTIEAVEESDAGNITCIVSGACGSDVTSDIAEVIVNTDIIAITEQPAKIEVCIGEQIDFSITASNISAYQWQKSGVNINDANASTYSIASVDFNDADNYTCIVSNDCGSVTSDAATLVVNTITEITQQPSAVDAAEGSEISFSVTATGTYLSYQWRFSERDIAGAEQEILTLSNVNIDNQGNYKVAVSGACGEITSDEVSLSVITSINDFSDYGITISPNPSNGIFRLSVEKIKHDIEVVVLNYDGRTIYKDTHNANNNTIDLSNEAKGMYLIKLIFDGNYLVSRIVIE